MTRRTRRDKVVPKEPPFVFGAMAQGSTVYVNDGTCPRGMIRQVSADMRYNRTRSCINLE